MSPTTLEYKKNILNRLSRIEGQVKGIQRMVDSEKQCGDILTQISAVRSAIIKAGALIFEEYTKGCILASDDSLENSKDFEDLLSNINTFLKITD